MVARAVVATKTIISARSETRTALKEQLLPRHKTPFAPEIEGMDHSKKFNLAKFTMPLWNHRDVFMCRVFPPSLGDLGLKWFYKLPPGSIRSLSKTFLDHLIQAGHPKEFVE